jgi:hypothetical protein
MEISLFFETSEILQKLTMLKHENSSDASPFFPIFASAACWLSQPLAQFDVSCSKQFNSQLRSFTTLPSRLGSTMSASLTSMICQVRTRLNMHDEASAYLP